jgi:uncharacterized membrane protein
MPRLVTEFAMTTLAIGLVLFLGVHSISIVSRSWRDSMAARVGPGAWRAIYSVLSILGFYLIVRGYSIARHDPIVLYQAPHALRWVTALLMLPVFPLLIAAYAPGRIKATVKHPMLAATKLWAVSHLLVNGTLADVLLFGAFLVWAGVDRVSVGRRPEPARPMFGGRERARSKSADIVAVVVGLAIYALFLGWAHVRLFGVVPTP